MSDIPIIHAIADARVLSEPDFAREAAAVMAALGPYGAIHLRARDLARRVLELAVELASRAATSKCRVVINERVDVALATSVWGIQLPARSFGIAEARRLAPAARLGASVHDIAEARSAANSRADWLLAGAVFATDSHPGATPRGIEWVSEVALLGVPVIAIGGVQAHQVAGLRAHGAHGVAAIRGIWDAADPETAARNYVQGARQDP